MRGCGNVITYAVGCSLAGGDGVPAISSDRVGDGKRKSEGCRSQTISILSSVPNENVGRAKDVVFYLTQWRRSVHCPRHGRRKKSYR